MPRRRLSNVFRKKRSHQRRSGRQFRFGKRLGVFEALEARRLLAVLTNGPGEGTVSVGVDGYGSFGSSVSSATTNAFYDPVGAIGSAGTTFESAIAIGMGGARQYISTGLGAGLTDPDISGSNAVANSSFSILGLDFALEQRLTDLFVGVGDGSAERSGSLLTQVYTIENPSAEAVSFDVVRYIDGDLNFDGSISDGGGRLPFGDSEILFETDSATGSADEATFVGITADGGIPIASNRFQISSYSGLRSTVGSGGALGDFVANDGPDADEFIDAGNGFDVTMALRNEFVIGAGESATYVARTIFGTGNPDALAQVDSLGLEPLEESAPVTTTHSVTATALDDGSEPVVGAAIQFDVTGSNPTSGVAFTDFEGRATFTYQGDIVGQDTITATAGLIASSPVTVDWAPIPNLLVSNPTSPTIARAGNQVEIGWTVTNADDATAIAPWDDAIYLSTDTTLDEFDVLIDGGIERTTDLATTDQYSRTRVVTIPSSVAVGDYFILIAADVDDAVFERSEADNVTSTPIEVALPDLLLEAAPTVSATGMPTFGESVDVSWTVQNSGLVAAELTTVDRIWLSSDSTLGNDTLLAEIPISSNLPLDPGALYSELASVNLPLSQDLAPGQYYIIVQADGRNTEAETDKSNNWQASELITIEGPPLPDLIVSSITAPLAAVSNGAIPISWQITNQGDVAVSGTFRDRVYLSSDQVIGSDTNYGTFDFIGTIGPGQTITRTQNITLPAVLEGDFYAVVTTDVSNEVFEQYGAENNNTTIDDQAIDVTLAPFPNLQVAEVIAPPNGSSSQEVVVEWIVTNTGSGATNTPRWNDSVYLSTDQNFDGADVFLGSAANPAFLPVGDSYRNSLTATLPRGIDGDYYFIVRTDSSNQVFELDGENDNQNVGGPTDVELTPPPDLQVTTVQGPTTAFSGQPVSVNWTVTNNGTGPSVATSWTDRVFLSADTVLDGADTLIASTGHNGALAVGESYSSSATGTLPIGISGDFYFIVQTDSSNSVFEHVFESNNTGFDETPTDVRLTPPPDLEVELVNAPATATASRQLVVDYRVGNLGATVTPNSSWTDRLYLSVDQLFDETDTLLQSRSHFGSLQAGQSYDASFNVTLPNDLTGEYFVFVVTDSGDVVFEGELGEANNVGLDAESLSISSQPADLTVSAFSGPSAAEAGETFLVNWSVQNIGVGDTAVSSWQDRVVLSTDQTLSADDIQLSSVGHNGLLQPSGEYSVTGQLVTIPFTVAPGDYFLLVATDAGGQVFEPGAEGNNLASSPINISRETSDLRITSVTASANASSGGLLNVSWVVQNDSPVTTNANFWFDEVYLSADSSIDATDVLLGTVQRSNPLGPSDQYLVNRDFTLPKDVSGQFFVILRTDATNLVVEGPFENNNDRATTGGGPGGNDGGIEVELTPPPDLTVSSVDAPNDAFSGQPLELMWTVENIGPGPAEGSWFDSVYLSLDQVFDRTTDLYLGFANRPGNLASGASYSQTASFQVPAGLSGPYWAFVVTDGNNRIAERGGELNNSSFDPLPIQVALTPPADFVVGTITVPSSGISGQNATIGYTVENQGANPAVGTWTDSIYLSADDQWDINDQLFGRVRNSNLTIAGGGSYSQSLTAALPGVVPGDYHVIIRSDILNQVRESDDANNIGVSLDQASIDFEELQLGVPTTGNLSEGQSVYYKVDVPAGETLSLFLDSAAAIGANEIYVAFDRVPSRSDFDFSSIEPFEVDQRALVPTTESGTYFVLLRGSGAPGGTQQFELSAELLDFDVFDSNFGVGGNVGNLTIEINGAKFDPSLTATLSNGLGLSVPALSIWHDSTVRAYATFDLRGMSAGQYDVEIGTSSAAPITIANGLTIASVPHRTVVPSVEAPATVRRNRGYAFTVGVANDSLNDIYSPVLSVSNSVPFGIRPGDLSLGSSHQFYASAADGPPGIIRPGESRAFTYFSFSDNSPGTHTVSVDRVYKDASGLFDWEPLRQQVRRYSLSDTEFNLTFETMVESLGATNDDFLAALASAANALPQSQAANATPAELIEWHFARFVANIRPSIAGTVAGPTAFAGSGYTISAENATTGEAFAATILQDGSFLFPSVTPGEYHLAVTGLIVETPNESFLVSSEASISDLAVSLSTGAALSIASPHTPSGNLPDGSVALVVASSGESFLATPDDNGVLTVDSLRPGEYSVIVDVPGRARLVTPVTVANEPLTIVADSPAESSISFSVTENGALPSGVVFAIATRESGGMEDTYFVELVDGEVSLEGLPAGQYSVVVVLDDQTESIEGVEVGESELVTLDTIDFTSEPPLPSNIAALHSTDLILEAQLAAAEAYLQQFFIPAITARFGFQVGSLWQAFLLSTPSTPISGSFSDGDAVVEGNFFENGFRDDPQVNSFLNDTLGMAAAAIRGMITGGSIDCEDEFAHGGQQFSINSLLGPSITRGINFNDVFSIPGNIAGGDGRFLSRQDDREITGNVTATLVGDSTLRVESNLVFTVTDAVDFEPGDLGASIERIFTVPLNFLEDNGHAWGVAYTASFTDEPGRFVDIPIPMQDCCQGPDCDDDDDDEDDIDRPASRDPNDILGPGGFGPENWVTSDQPLNYTIRFENDPIFASAPAQVVRITQQLDGDLDSRTFRVGDFAIGTHFFEVPDNQAFFTDRLDLTDELGVLIDVFASIDVQTGEAFWEFTSVDPETGEQPEDALAGFLPPNLMSPEGEGFVTYSVRPRSTAQTGDIIDAEARIIFDVNEPIDTPPIFNTLDADLPTSSVEALPVAVGATTFEVMWAGMDVPGGSGIASYDVFVSENGGTFTPFLIGTTLTSAPFVGQAGRRYEFYSIARDNAGNVEAIPAEPDAVTVTPGLPPVVVATEIQDGLSQRSYVDTFSIDFSNEMNLAGLISGGEITSAITLVNLGVDVAADADLAIPLSADQFTYEYDAGEGLSRLTWALGTGTPLSDGLYELTINADLVTNLAGSGLDGNGDEIAGDNYVLTFHRLLGDADGDRDVDTDDMQVVNAALGARPTSESWDANADLDRDGVVSVRDRIIVARATGNAIVEQVTLVGDFNGDGVVDAADYSVWRDNLGTTATTGPLAGDANGDLVVDTDDYGLWRSNYGARLPSSLVDPPTTAPAASDANGDGNVDGADLDAWQVGFETSSASVVVPSDGNGDGTTSGADFLQWQRSYSPPTPTPAAAAGSFDSEFAPSAIERALEEETDDDADLGWLAYSIARQRASTRPPARNSLSHVDEPAFEALNRHISLLASTEKLISPPQDEVVSSQSVGAEHEPDDWNTDIHDAVFEESELLDKFPSSLKRHLQVRTA